MADNHLQKEILTWVFFEDYRPATTLTPGSEVYSYEKKLNIFELIRQEHRIISDLLDQLDRTTDLLTRYKLFYRLKGILLLHTSLEEKIFYSAMSLMKLTHRPVTHFCSENRKMIELLHQLEDYAFSKKWSKPYRRLKKSIKNHIAEEENNLFILAEQVFNEQQIRDFARVIRYERQRLLNLAQGRQPLYN